MKIHRLISSFLAIAIVMAVPNAGAQLKYDPYGTDAIIDLSNNRPGPGGRPPPEVYYAPPRPYYSPPVDGAYYGPPNNGSYGVGIAKGSHESGYDGPNYDTRGYKGVSAASQAGAVAGISTCEMLAGAAVVAAIAALAILFNGSSVHLH